jgi:hypothetical protein
LETDVYVLCGIRDWLGLYRPNRWISSLEAIMRGYRTEAAYQWHVYINTVTREVLQVTRSDRLPVPALEPGQELVLVIAGDAQSAIVKAFEVIRCER